MRKSLSAREPIAKTLAPKTSRREPRIEGRNDHLAFPRELIIAPALGRLERSLNDRLVSHHDEAIGIDSRAQPARREERFEAAVELDEGLKVFLAKKRKSQQY